MKFKGQGAYSESRQTAEDVFPKYLSAVDAYLQADYDKQELIHPEDRRREINK